MCDLDVWSYVARLGVRLRPPEDAFFSSGDAVCVMRQCVTLTQEDTEEFLHPEFKEFSCSVQGCQETFRQLLDFETHYNSLHRHSCHSCGRTLPSAHLLELHVVETHDSYFALASKKRPSYECFLEKCPDKFWTDVERRDHCIQRHQFPADFKFDEARKAKKSAGHGGGNDQRARRDRRDPGGDERMEVEGGAARATPKREDRRRASIREKKSDPTPPSTPRQLHHPTSPGSAHSQRTIIHHSRSVEDERAHGGGGSKIPSPRFFSASASPRRAPSGPASPRKPRPRPVSAVYHSPTSEKAVLPGVAAASATTTNTKSPAVVRRSKVGGDGVGVVGAAAGTQKNIVERRRFSLSVIMGPKDGEDQVDSNAARRRSQQQSPGNVEKKMMEYREPASASAVMRGQSRESSPEKQLYGSNGSSYGGSSSSYSNPASPVKRTSLSLARMGERLSVGGGGSSIFSSNSLLDDAASSPTTTTNSSISSTASGSGAPSAVAAAAADQASPSPRRVSRIPVFRHSPGGGGGGSNGGSGQKKELVPKTISFGSGVQKAFNQKKHWHQQQQHPRATPMDIENSNFEIEMAEALP